MLVAAGSDESGGDGKTGINSVNFITTYPFIFRLTLPKENAEMEYSKGVNPKQGE